MAETPNKISRMKKPRSPCFLCCFVSRKEKFSGNISSRTKVVESGNSSKKETIGLFSWSIFRIKIRNHSAKTVPLDPSDKSTDLSKSKIRSSKSSSNSKSKWNIQKLFNKRTNSTTKATSFRKASVIVNEIIEETTQGPEQDSTLEYRKSLDHADISKDATCRKRVSFRRKIDSIRTESNQPASPHVVIRPNTKPARTGKSATPSHTAPMPVSAHERWANPLSKSRVGTKKTRRDGNVTVNKFDPVVGMSILVVTLVIMLIWGRFCAILCTSAWLYFTPRLRALKNDNDDDDVMKINGDLDLNSEEYKRRVVLEGFLDRDHRVVAAAVVLR